MCLYASGLEHLVASGRTAECRIGTADNIDPTAMGVGTSLQMGRWHRRVHRPGVAGDVVHLVHILCRDPVPPANGVDSLARMTCDKTGARRGHGRQSSRPGVRFRVVHIDLARDACGTGAPAKDKYLVAGTAVE